MKEESMKKKMKMKAAYSEYSFDEDMPNYAEELKRVRTSYDRIKPLMAGKESSVRNRLSAELRIPVEIIDEFLNYGEYIGAPVLKTLAESRINKHFFDLSQKVKRQLIKIYRHDELSDKKIMLKVSQAILKMYHEYIEKGKINTKDWQRFLKGENGIENVKKPKLNNSTVRKSKKFKYWTGEPQPSEAKLVNLNDIDKMLDDVCQGIQNINIFASVKLCILADKVKKQCLGLAKIHQLMLELESKQSRNQPRDLP
jgi:hypothetical protein